MPNRAASRPTSIRRRLAVSRAQGSGAIRTDMVVLGLAVVAVLGILIISDMNRADPVSGEGAGEASAATVRTVSAVGLRAPEPAPRPGDAPRQSFASDGYEERFTSSPDNERAFLEAETEAARAAEAAAGGPPPVAGDAMAADDTGPAAGGS